MKKVFLAVLLTLSIAAFATEEQAEVKELPNLGQVEMMVDNASACKNELKIWKKFKTQCNRFKDNKEVYFDMLKRLSNGEEQVKKLPRDVQREYRRLGKKVNNDLAYIHAFKESIEKTGETLY